MLPDSTNLPQVRTEQLLLEGCKAAGVDFAWDSEIVAVDPSPDGVRLATKAGAEWTADYVVGADGAQSAVLDRWRSRWRAAGSSGPTSSPTWRRMT